VRFIEHLPVVSGLPAADPASIKDLQIGDAITELDGVPVAALIDAWMPYYSASNEAARLRDVGRSMTAGACGATSIAIRRDNRELKLTVNRLPLTANDFGPGPHDLPGPASRLLSKDVAYLKLSSVKSSDAPHYVEQAIGTKGLIIDIRNYPSDFMVFSLGSLLVDAETPFARFTVGDLSNPGAFHWMNPVSLRPANPHYSGKDRDPGRRRLEEPGRVHRHGVPRRSRRTRRRQHNRWGGWQRFAVRTARRAEHHD
jgi:hypothetical protein